MRKQTEMLTVRVSKQLRRTLRKHGRATKRSEGEIVRVALENHFAQQDPHSGGAAAPKQKTPVQYESNELHSLAQAA